MKDRTQYGLLQETYYKPNDLVLKIIENLKVFQKTWKLLHTITTNEIVLHVRQNNGQGGMLGKDTGLVAKLENTMKCLDNINYKIDQYAFLTSISRVINQEKEKERNQEKIGHFNILDNIEKKMQQILRWMLGYSDCLDQLNCSQLEANHEISKFAQMLSKESLNIEKEKVSAEAQHTFYYIKLLKKKNYIKVGNITTIVSQKKKYSAYKQFSMEELITKRCNFIQYLLRINPGLTPPKVLVKQQQTSSNKEKGRNEGRIQKSKERKLHLFKFINSGYGFEGINSRQKVQAGIQIAQLILTYQRHYIRYILGKSIQFARINNNRLKNPLYGDEIKYITNRKDEELFRGVRKERQNYRFNQSNFMIYKVLYPSKKQHTFKLRFKQYQLQKKLLNRVKQVEQERAKSSCRRNIVSAYICDEYSKQEVEQIKEQTQILTNRLIISTIIIRNMIVKYCQWSFAAQKSLYHVR